MLYLFRAMTLVPSTMAGKQYVLNNYSLNKYMPTLWTGFPLAIPTLF